MPNNTTGLVRITVVPDGPWPYIIRAAWLGLELPCEQYFRRNVNREGRFEVMVPQDKAVEILAKVAPQAAKFWEDKGFSKPDACFGFGLDEIQVLNDSVCYHRIIEIPSEAQGSLTR